MPIKNDFFCPVFSRVALKVQFSKGFQNQTIEILYKIFVHYLMFTFWNWVPPHFLTASWILEPVSYFRELLLHYFLDRDI